MLHGEKVLLRPFDEADFEDWFAMRQDHELELAGSGYWAPRGRQIWRERFAADLQASPEYRVLFAIEADTRLIGAVGFREMDRRSGTAELFIHIGVHEYLGRGYGRDAIRLALDWAFRMHNLRRIWLTTAATNERAVRAYRACGFVEEGRLRAHEFVAGRYVDMISMGLLRDEWSGQPGNN